MHNGVKFYPTEKKNQMLNKIIRIETSNRKCAINLGYSYCSLSLIFLFCYYRYVAVGIHYNTNHGRMKQSNFISLLDLLKVVK